MGIILQSTLLKSVTAHQRGKSEKDRHTSQIIVFFHSALRERAPWSQVPCDLLETLMTKVLTFSECLITLNVTSRFNSAISVSSTALFKSYVILAYNFDL